jgi:hypothetical protein
MKMPIPTLEDLRSIAQEVRQELAAVVAGWGSRTLDGPACIAAMGRVDVAGDRLSVEADRTAVAALGGIQLIAHLRAAGKITPAVAAEENERLGTLMRTAQRTSLDSVNDVTQAYLALQADEGFRALNLRRRAGGDGPVS